MSAVVKAVAPIAPAAAAALASQRARIQTLADHLDELHQRLGGLTKLRTNLASARAQLQTAREAHTAEIAAQLAAGKRASLNKSPAELTATQALEAAEQGVAALGGEAPLVQAVADIEQQIVRAQAQISAVRATLPRYQRDVIVEQLILEADPLRDAISALASRLRRVGALAAAANELARPGTSLLRYEIAFEIETPNLPAFAFPSAYEIRSSALADAKTILKELCADGAEVDPAVGPFRGSVRQGAEAASGSPRGNFGR